MRDKFGEIAQDLIDGYISGDGNAIREACNLIDPRNAAMNLGVEKRMNALMWEQDLYSRGLPRLDLVNSDGIVTLSAPSTTFRQLNP